MQNNYFSSDFHFGHRNIIEYDNRPFSSIEEMNETIINNCNNLIKSNDNLYFLGDIALCHIKQAEEYISRLQGNLYFIKGNHDNKDIIKLYEKYGTYLGNLCEVNVQGQRIVMCHYAMRVWNKSHRGTWHLYGHSHHSLPDNPNSLSIDVGINGHNYKPLSFEQIREIMSKKDYKPIDHHR